MYIKEIIMINNTIVMNLGTAGVFIYEFYGGRDIVRLRRGGAFCLCIYFYIPLCPCQFQFWIFILIFRFYSVELITRDRERERRGKRSK